MALPCQSPKCCRQRGAVGFAHIASRDGSRHCANLRKIGRLTVRGLNGSARY
jgi:hypothetical protein